jgi:hypothetical protein
VELAQGDELQRDYVPLILRAMACKKATQRKLAHLTGISKSRLGVLLHSKPEKRVTMTLPEFETILHALGMNLVCQSACKRDPLSARKRDPLSRWRKVDRTRAFALRAA